MNASGGETGTVAVGAGDLLLFRVTVLDHYRREGRHTLPWRLTADPYAIWVSEIMLQQTQVDRVAAKYTGFLSLFPDIAALAAAPLTAVLAAWQGLGYNRRAVNLQKGAKQVMELYRGRFPADISRAEGLPGIGPYTARAIAAFAFGVPSPFIETNIRTVFLHHFFADRQGIHDREILPLAEAVLDRDDPRTWYYALMDYGAMLKKSTTNPGRRSAHHVRQSPFRGSNRQLRSRILKAVLERPGLTAADLSLFLTVERDQVEANVAQMEREGFMTAEKGRLRIR